MLWLIVGQCAEGKVNGYGSAGVVLGGAQVARERRAGGAAVAFHSRAKGIEDAFYRHDIEHGEADPTLLPSGPGDRGILGLIWAINISSASRCVAAEENHHNRVGSNKAGMRVW
jgi:hypothetical protein